MKQAEFLRFYAARLPSVELNTTFYQLPSEERLRVWAAQTPPDFEFAVKMSRRITHFRAPAGVRSFCEQARALGERLGPILVQFAPTRLRDDGLLRLVLDALAPGLRYAFEFRHPSWDVDDALAEAGVTRVNSLEGATDFRYLRLREPPYDDAALAAWAARLRPLLAGGIDVYCYFKHEDEPSAPRYAQRLLELVRSRR
jgi:uncharacterized protein YecE (DUF72 family)